jgi:hypothetical protein
MKQVVHYAKHKYQEIHVGQSAIVWPLDHPSELASNTSSVRTSEVLSYDKETGTFETKNTIYKLINNFSEFA